MSEPALLGRAATDYGLANIAARGEYIGCLSNARVLPANLDEQARSGGSRSWQSPLDSAGHMDHELSEYGRRPDTAPSSRELQQHPRHSQSRRPSHAQNSILPAADSSAHSPDAGAGFATERHTNKQLCPSTMLGSRGPEELSACRRISDVTVSSGQASIAESIGSQLVTESSISICTPDAVPFDVSESTQDESSSTSRRASQASNFPSRRSSLSSTPSHAQPPFVHAATAPEEISPRRASSQTPKSSITIFELHRQVANALSEGDFEEVHCSASDYVGLPGLQGLFASQVWGSSGEQFHALKLYLQAMGISPVSPPFAQPLVKDPCSARALHCGSLAFMLSWHLALWVCLLVVAIAFFTPGSEGALFVPSFFQVVQTLLLFVTIAAHALCIRLSCGRTLVVLLEIASRWSFIRCWERYVYQSALFLILLDALLSGSAAFAGTALLEVGHQKGETYVATSVLLATASWTLLLTLYLLLLMVVQFCSLGLDAFALDLLNAPGASGLSGLVGQFNVLLAGIRRGAYAVQFGLAVFVGLTLVLEIAALCLIALPGLPSGGGVRAWDDAPGESCSGACDGTGDLIVVVWVTALLCLGLRLLNHIAVVNLKCKRLPALVHSLDFGQEIDHDRWCVAAHIAASEAGFPVHSVLITRGAVLKMGYISLAGLCLLITRLVVEHGDQDQ